MIATVVKHEGSAVVAGKRVRSRCLSDVEAQVGIQNGPRWAYVGRKMGPLRLIGGLRAAKLDLERVLDDIGTHVGAMLEPKIVEHRSHDAM